jgi:hypothetical protein
VARFYTYLGSTPSNIAVDLYVRGDREEKSSKDTPIPKMPTTLKIGEKTMRKAVIGIASISNGEVRTELPVAKVYLSDDGEFLFLERKVLDRAIALSLQNLEAGESTLILVSVEILPMSNRRRRGE